MKLIQANMRIKWSISAILAVLVASTTGCMREERSITVGSSVEKDVVMQWHLADGGKVKGVGAVVSIGASGVPLVNKNLLNDGGLVAGRHGDVLRIYSVENGALLAEGEILRGAGPVEIIGFSPEGEHLFYIRDMQIPGRPQLRMIDFSQGVDREIFSVQDYRAYELVFDPSNSNSKVFMVFGSREGTPFKLFQGMWVSGQIRDITEIKLKHTVLDVCHGFLVLLSLSASGERLFFHTCEPQTRTHRELPPGFQREVPL